MVNEFLTGIWAGNSETNYMYIKFEKYKMNLENLIIPESK
jgi:hypothetical protein